MTIIRVIFLTLHTKIEIDEDSLSVKDTIWAT